MWKLQKSSYGNSRRLGYAVSGLQLQAGMCFCHKEPQYVYWPEALRSANLEECHTISSQEDLARSSCKNSLRASHKNFHASTWHTEHLRNACKDQFHLDPKRNLYQIMQCSRGFTIVFTTRSCATSCKDFCMVSPGRLQDLSTRTCTASEDFTSIYKIFS